jgi:PAS domain S-box-containing protein
MPTSSRGALPLGLIADSGVVGVVLWDASGAIHEANDRFLEILGYRRAEFAGRGLGWLDLAPPESHALEQQDIDRLRERRVARSEERQYRRKDGSPVFARKHSVALADGSGRVLSILVDISDQKRAQAELRDLMERETAARAEAEAAVRSRDDILAIVSHDLRNPLSVIAMGASLLDSALPEDKRAAQVGIIRRAVAGMNRLISDLMDVSQITRGALRVDIAPIDAAVICEDAVGHFTPLLASKNQELRCGCKAAGTPVLADRERVAQVLGNLIGNAHKFTPEGGRIELAATALPDCVRFTVTDTGPGLAAEDQPYVFERFWQARRVRRGGVGLGLPITKGIVDAHKGRIWVESSPGVGTAFHFTLPLAAGQLP